MAVLDFLRERTGNAAAADGAERREGLDASNAAPKQALRRRYVVTAAELAECTCPDFCERDHSNE